jgi:hypothetical protein
MVSLLVAMCAVAGIGKGARLNEVVALDQHRPWNKRLILAEAKVISLAYFVGVLFAIGFLAEDTRDDARQRTKESSTYSRQNDPSPSVEFHWVIHSFTVTLELHP